MLPHVFAVHNNGARRFVGDFPSVFTSWGTESEQKFNANPGDTSVATCNAVITNEHDSDKRIKVATSSFGGVNGFNLVGYIPVIGYKDPVIQCRFFQTDPYGEGNSSSYHAANDPLGSDVSGQWYTLGEGSSRTFRWYALAQEGEFVTGFSVAGADDVYFEIRVTEGDYDPEERTSSTQNVRLSATITSNEPQ